MYELLVELLESTGADRLESEDPARLRAGAEAKLAEITEVGYLFSWCAREPFPVKFCLQTHLHAMLSSCACALTRC